ncbi:MAG: Maf family protein [Lachnospiraceae bacterium]|nr:Maf family protein [Lachnospiraceae bacterium]
MKKIILASASPRRKELMEQIGLEFEVIPSRAEEVITSQEPGEVVKELSAQKAADVAGGIQEGIVIGSDTIVYHDGHIMGKPADRDEARGMLRSIQGNTHSVFTGVTVIVKEKEKSTCHTFFRETKVRVYPMTEQETEKYLDTGEPMDKAGAYGIQGKFAAWIESIEGDYNTVVGLPVSALWQVLKQYC